MSFRDELYGAVADYLDWTLPERYPNRTWGTVARILDIKEEVSPAHYDEDWGVDLTITWLNSDGMQHSIEERMTMVEFIDQLEKGRV